MAKDFSSMEDSNRSSNPSIHELSGPTRRTLLRGGLGATLAGVLAPLAGCATGSMAGGPLLGFKSVPVSTADKVMVPEGYIVFDDPLHGSCLGAMQAIEETLLHEDRLFAEQMYPHPVYRYPPVA